MYLVLSRPTPKGWGTIPRPLAFWYCFTYGYTQTSFLSFSFFIFFSRVLVVRQCIWLLAHVCAPMCLCLLLCVSMRKYMYSFSQPRTAFAAFRRMHKLRACRDTSPGEHRIVEWSRACCIHRHVCLSSSRPPACPLPRPRRCTGSGNSNLLQPQTQKPLSLGSILT